MVLYVQYVTETCKIKKEEYNHVQRTYLELPEKLTHWQDAMWAAHCKVNIQNKSNDLFFP